MKRLLIALALICAACTPTDTPTTPQAPTATATQVVASTPLPESEMIADEPTSVAEQPPPTLPPAPTIPQGDAQCAGIRATLDVLGTPYDVVDTSVGKVCVEEDTYLYVDVPCSAAGHVAEEIGLPDAVLYGCDE